MEGARHRWPCAQSICSARRASASLVAHSTCARKELALLAYLAVEAAASAAEQRGDHNVQCGYARWQLALEPWRETAHAQLMRELWACDGWAATVIGAHTSWISAVAWSSGGARLASSNTIGEIVQWDGMGAAARVGELRDEGPYAGTGASGLTDAQRRAWSRSVRSTALAIGKAEALWRAGEIPEAPGEQIREVYRTSDTAVGRAVPRVSAWPIVRRGLMR